MPRLSWKLMLIAAAMAGTQAAGAQPATDAKPAAPQGASHAAGAAAAVFATVDSTTITAAEYDLAFAQAQRSRFYHRQVPDHERQALRREVGDQLINRVLLLAEAKRLGLTPDRAKIDAQLAGYEKQYGASPQWPRMKAEMLPGLVAELERQSLLERLEQQARQVAAPNDEQLQAFYQARQPLFTEPAKQRVSLVLLGVDPSSGQPAWDAATAEAKSIRERIVNGADFAAQARLHSADRTAKDGGDMGWMHRGQMPDDLVDKLEKLALGEVSEPIIVLEGVALFRIEARQPATLRSFADVKPRATQLWQREQGEQAWQALVAKLRAAAAVSIKDASRYPEVAAAAATPAR